MKTPITKKTLQSHLHYSWWKYALLAVIGIFGWNIVYTVTAYRPPEDKKVVTYLYCAGDQEKFDAYLKTVWDEILPDMDEVSGIFMAVDETYGPQVLTTYMFAAEGDIYVLPKAEYQSYAGQGAFMELENNEELMAICDAAGMDLTNGWRRNSETGERHLYGIPVDMLPGLKQYLAVDSGACVGVTVFNGNEENTMKLLLRMVQDTCTVSESK